LRAQPLEFRRFKQRHANGCDAPDTSGRLQRRRNCDGGAGVLSDEVHSRRPGPSI
jgi:hypothetical protein